MKDFDPPFPTSPTQQSWLFKRALRRLGVEPEPETYLEDLEFDIAMLQLYDSNTDDGEEVVERYSNINSFPVKNGIIFRAPTRIRLIKININEQQYTCQLRYHPDLDNNDDTPSDDRYTVISMSSFGIQTVDLSVHRYRHTNNDSERQLEPHQAPKASQVLIDDVTLKQILPLQFHELIGGTPNIFEEEIFIRAETVPDCEIVRNPRDYLICGFNILTTINSDTLRGFKSINPIIPYDSFLYDNDKEMAGFEVRDIRFNPNTIGCVRIFHDVTYIHDIQFFKRIDYLDMPDIPPISPNDFNKNINGHCTFTDLCFYKTSEDIKEKCDIKNTYMAPYDDFMIDPYDSLKGFNMKDYCKNDLIALQLVTIKGRKSKFYGGIKYTERKSRREANRNWLSEITPPEGHTIVGVHARVNLKEKWIRDLGITYARLD